MQNKSNVTIKDIAKQLGISFSTVAKALNDDPVVAELTRKRVKKKAEEMGYFPNLMAIGLRSKSTHSIGVILNDLENPTRSYIIKQISIEMVRYGFTTFIFDSAYDKKLEERNITNLLSRMPDGILISPVEKDFSNIHQLENVYDRTIILSKKHEGFLTNYVHMDHVKGGYLAASKMLAMGHKKNLIIMEPPNYPSAVQFYAGIKEAHHEFGFEFDDRYISYAFPNLEGGTNALERFFDKQRKKFKLPITGVIASNDLMAIGVYQAAQNLGIRIPDQISVIGYDDLPIATLVTPKLSTLIYPKEKIANYCTEILIAKITGNDSRIYEYSLEPEFIMRESILDIS